MKDRYAREIVNGFPYPIASIYVRLRTDECLDPGPNRLKYLLATGEAVARFLGMVNLCQARDYAEATGNTPSQSLNATFQKTFQHVGFGAWLNLARDSLHWLLMERAELFMPEMSGIFFDSRLKESATAKALAKLVELRNSVSHDRIKAMHTSDYKLLCHEVQGYLDSILEELEFLLEYELSFISEIGVIKSRLSSPDFLHSFKKLIGNSEDFEGDRAAHPHPLDTRAVVLRRVDNGHDCLLNLDPLLIYEEAKNKPPEGKATDIFFYNGMECPTKAEYIACKHGGRFLSGHSDRADTLKDELTGLLALFTNKPILQPAVVI